MKLIATGVFTVCLFGYGLAYPPTQPQAITNLFQVNFGTNDAGGCMYIGPTNMQQLLQDAFNLANIGIQLTQDYSAGVGEARRLLDAFFSVPTPPMTQMQLTNIATYYTTIRDWIGQGGTYNGTLGRPPPNPYLFCYHSWLEKKTMQDTALSTEGLQFPNVYNGTAALIQDVYRLVDAQQTEATALGRGKRAVPYWSVDHKDYLFDQAYSASAAAGLCSGQGFFAAVSHKLQPSTMTLCPRALGAPRNAAPANLGALNIISRRQTAPVPIPQASIGRGRPSYQNLLNVMPTASTLLHELFHLVLGNPDTYPDYGEVYNLFGGQIRMVGLDYANAFKNPESFTAVAVAYDYTLNYDVQAGQPSIEFYTGYTTQG